MDSPYTTIISDLSRTLLFPKKDDYRGSLNKLYKKVTRQQEVNDYFRFNDELLAFLKTLKDTFQLYVFTTGTVQDDPALAQQLHAVFRTVYSIHNLLDLPKDDPRAYKELAKMLGVAPPKIIFIDDLERNVWAAESAGLTTILHRSNDQTISELKRLLGME